MTESIGHRYFFKCKRNTFQHNWPEIGRHSHVTTIRAEIFQSKGPSTLTRIQKYTDSFYRKRINLIRVHTSTKIYGFALFTFESVSKLIRIRGSDPRVSVDGRPKRIKKYTDLNQSALVWTGPKHCFPVYGRETFQISQLIERCNVKCSNSKKEKENSLRAGN